jgi:ABC-type uncharacterized transport system substrate-binding protein
MSGVTDLTARDVKSVTTTIPVVLMTGDPVGSADRQLKPGGNITGVSMMQGFEGCKRGRAPVLARVGLMFNRDNPTTVKRCGQR